jgi:hypothetical protein
MTVTFIEIENPEGLTVEHALIAHADGSFTSMTKEAYEAQQAEQSTPIVTADE